VKRFDRVWETTTQTGTDAYVLAGAKSEKYRAFGDPGVLEDGDYTEYFATDGTDWERGWGKYTTATTTLTRNLIESSTGSLIDWGSGTKDVFIAPPAASLNDISGIYVGTSRPVWLPSNRPWFDSDASSPTLYWYDGTGDREIGALVSNKFVPYSNGLPLPYAMGSWEPALTFATPGDLSITYSIRLGRYLRLGSLVLVTFTLQSSSFTHTTASSFARITGLPFAGRTLTNARWYGALTISGVTKANYTDFQCRVTFGESVIGLTANGSGRFHATVNAADMPSGGTITLTGTVTYETDAS